MVRPVHILFLFALLPLTGCSALIMSSGTDLAKLKTRTEVQQTFGKPTTMGEEDGAAYEHYRTRRKIRDWESHDVGYAFALALTAGLIEVVATPVALCKVTERFLLGQDLHFTYNATGQVIAVARRKPYSVPSTAPTATNEAVRPQSSIKPAQQPEE